MGRFHQENRDYSEPTLCPRKLSQAHFSPSMDLRVMPFLQLQLRTPLSHSPVLSSSVSRSSALAPLHVHSSMRRLVHVI